MITLAPRIRALAAATLFVLPLLSAAQSDYPTRPVKILVPYAPGGATDIIARHVAGRLNDVLGQSVVVENRAGASGNVALDAAAKSPADGYTLLCGNVSTNAINETTFAQTLQIEAVARSHRHHQAGRDPAHHRRHAVAPGRVGRRPRRAGEAEPRQAQLRLGGARHLPASRHGGAGAQGGHRC